VASDKEGKAAEHALLGDPLIDRHELAHALGEMLVICHEPII